MFSGSSNKYAVNNDRNNVFVVKAFHSQQVKSQNVNTAKRYTRNELKANLHFHYNLQLSQNAAAQGKCAVRPK